MRVIALKETGALVGKLEEMRKHLELPQSTDMLAFLAAILDNRLAQLLDNAYHKQLDAETKAMEDRVASGAPMMTPDQVKAAVGCWGMSGVEGTLDGVDLVPSGTGCRPHLVSRDHLDHPPSTTRESLSFESTDKTYKPHRIKPGEIFTVTARPQRRAFRIEEIEIDHAKPDDWEVLDVMVGRRSQRANAGPPIPGRHFAKGGICSSMIFDTAQTAMDIDLIVRYIGANPEGEVFEATAVGTVAT
jgi:hypothetical protein